MAIVKSQIHWNWMSGWSFLLHGAHPSYINQRSFPPQQPRAMDDVILPPQVAQKLGRSLATQRSKLQNHKLKLRL